MSTAPAAARRFCVFSLVALAVACTLLTACTPPRIDTGQDGRLTGDARLLGQIRSTFADDFNRAAVAVVDGDDVRKAFVNADDATVFEVGSTTSVLTGELLAIAIERREVELDDTLGDYLDLGNSAVGSVTLRTLATHTSGVPPLPTDPDWIAAFDRAMGAGEDPTDDDLDELLELARELDVSTDEAFEVSFVGVALLGHALAAAAETTYSDLLTARVLEPLGMDNAVLVETPEQVPAAHAGGHTEVGDAVEPWSVGAFSPAGGVHATLDDHIALAKAVIDGTLAGSAALEPIEDADASEWRIGYQWFIVEDRSRTITVSGGDSGGFTSSVLINRDADTAAIVLSNASGADTYHVALRLLLAAER